MKKSKLFLSVAAFMLCASTAISAVPEVFETISVQLRPDIEIYVDGEVQVLTDTNGNEISPIVYEGTTYIPLRLAGEIAGSTVSWDGTTNAINLDAAVRVDENNRINVQTANLELAQLEDFINNFAYPDHFVLDTFEYSDEVLTIYLHQSDEETWASVFEAVAAPIYDKFSGIEAIIFEIDLPYDTITKEYDYDWYLDQMNQVATGLKFMKNSI